MTSVQQVRKAALAQPEAEESKEAGRLQFSVRGTTFAAVDDAGPATERMLRVWLSEDRSQEVLADHPEAELLERGGVAHGVRVPLAEINGMACNAIVRDAWLHRAPRRLVTAHTPVTDHALPSGIGAPATRALTGAGITSLDDVAAMTDAELLALHGVGPRAVALLKEALAPGIQR